MTKYHLPPVPRAGRAPAVRGGMRGGPVRQRHGLLRVGRAVRRRLQPPRGLSAALEDGPLCLPLVSYLEKN